MADQDKAISLFFKRQEGEMPNTQVKEVKVFLGR